MSSNDNLEILKRLDKIISLLMTMATGDRSFREQVWTLSSAGFQPAEIATFLGKKPNHIRVALSGLRKENKAR